MSRLEVPESGVPLAPQTGSGQPANVTDERSLSGRLDGIVRRAQALTGSSGAAIALREGERMVTRASAGSAAPDVGTELRLEGSFTGMCVQSGEALCCLDAESDPRVDAAACRALNTRSIVVTPIRDRSAVLGVLAVFAARPRAFNTRHLHVLGTLADVVRELAQPQLLGAPPSAPQPNADPAVADHASSSVVALPQSAQERAARRDSFIKSSREKPDPPAAEEQFPLVRLVRCTDAYTPALEPATAPLESAPEPEYQPDKNLLLPAEEPLMQWTPRYRVRVPFGDEGLGSFNQIVPASDTRGRVLAIAAVVLVVALLSSIWMYRRALAAGEGAPEISLQPPRPPVDVIQSPLTPLSRPDKRAEDKPEKIAVDVVERASSKAREDADAGRIVVAPERARRRKLAPGSQDEEAPQLAVIAASRPNLLPDAPAPVLPSRPVPKSSATALPGQLIYRVPPVYPQMARNLGFQATLVLKVQIAKDGSVRDVRLVRGERMFLESATTAVKQWRYRPAFLNGQPVESTADVVLRFTGPK